ncbi:MAG: hypothetical protein Kow006_31650 [Gammaproteobacteria bacterium]
MSAPDRYSNTFYFETHDGRRLYPVRMKNRDTGVLAFRVSKDGNKKSDGREVDELEMARLVLDLNWSVRVAERAAGATASLRSPQGRSIRRVVRIGQLSGQR